MSNDDQILAALGQIMERLDALEGRAETPAVPRETEQYPDWNEDVPTALTLVPEPTPEPPQKPSGEISEIGAAFRSRPAAVAHSAPTGDIEWEAIGDIPMGRQGDSNRGSGHFLTESQIARMYQRDQAQRLRPGPTAEDQGRAHA